MYFSFFKPQDWRKRSIVRGLGFIQRFLGIKQRPWLLLRSVSKNRLHIGQQPVFRHIQSGKGSDRKGYATSMWLAFSGSRQQA